MGHWSWSRSDRAVRQHGWRSSFWWSGAGGSGLTLLPGDGCAGWSSPDCRLREAQPQLTLAVRPSHPTTWVHHQEDAQRAVKATSRRVFSPKP